jgi:hypothetical protein
VGFSTGVAVSVWQKRRYAEAAENAEITEEEK